MEKIKLEGNYLDNQLTAGRGELEGNAIVNPDKEFKGVITDSGTSDPHQVIHGRFRVKPDVVRLEFFKYPSNDNLANIFYRLEKPGEGIEGEYIGRWMTLPYKIEMDETQPLAIAQIDPSVLEISNGAMLTVSRL